ncbi:MAG: 3-keto-5-aminohexanoate cleavage protein [Chthoniobacterales bacterium]
MSPVSPETDGSPMDLILNFVPTGMLPTKADNPHVPVTIEEILADIAAVQQLGITMVHVHVRDAAQQPTLDTGFYAELVSGIREIDPQLVVCVSCSGRRSPELAARRLPLTLTGNAKPDLASLTLSSLNFTRQASITSPETLTGLATEMLRHGIVPEIEIFDTGMMNVLRYLREHGNIHDPCYINLILGNIASAQCEPGVLGLLLGQLPPGALWSLGGIGSVQLPANALGIALGGGVRVGLEDNLFFDQARQQPATNLSLVERVHSLARIHRRKIMSPADFRSRLRLLPGHGSYGREPISI